jgi:hypothetical protein
MPQGIFPILFADISLARKKRKAIGERKPYLISRFEACYAYFELAATLCSPGRASAVTPGTHLWVKRNGLQKP